MEVVSDDLCPQPNPSGVGVCQGECLPTSWEYGEWSEVCDVITLCNDVIKLLAIAESKVFSCSSCCACCFFFLYLAFNIDITIIYLNVMKLIFRSCIYNHSLPNVRDLI